MSTHWWGGNCGSIYSDGVISCLQAQSIAIRLYRFAMAPVAEGLAIRCGV